MKKIMNYLILIIVLLALIINKTMVYAIKIDIEGVSQGTDDVTFAKDAPLSDIIIDQSVLADYSNSTYEVFNTHKGFKILTKNELESMAYTTDYKFVGDGPRLVYDESVEGAVKVTNNINSMNYFEGDIASFTYKDAALLPDGTKGNVVITYSNIHLPLQTNFGQNTGVNSNDYSKFYNCDITYSSKISNNLKNGYNCSDFWKYNDTTKRGEYLKPAVYSIGYGYWIRGWNNIVSDATSNSSSNYTTRYGIKMDVKIQVVDKSENIIDGVFMFPMVDIDQSRANTGFKFLYNANKEDNYSESVEINSGIDKDSKVYIPGDVEGNDAKQYKYTTVRSIDGKLKFTGSISDPDPGSIYSGFVTIINNNNGLNITTFSNGAQRATVSSYLLQGYEFHKIISSSGTGGTIKTTKSGNPNGDLTDGSVIYNSGTADVPVGKTVKYTMTPNKGYTVDNIVVDGQTLTIPNDNEKIKIIIDGPDDDKKTGILTNIENGKFSFEFPDNNYNHEISVSWKSIIYSITYELNGGINNVDNPSEYTVDDYIKIKDPTKENHTFLGWEEGDEIPLGSTGAKHFTAIWEKMKYPITYELNGGINNVDNPSEYTIDDYIKIKDPTKENHTFLGWEEGDEIPLGSTGTKHFTAKWKKIEESLPHGNSSIPQTGDNIMISVFMLLISLAGLFGGILYIKKKINKG